MQQKVRLLKKGKQDGEYIEMFKVSKLHAESGSIVYFKVNFKLYKTPVQNGERMVEMVKIQIL